ncbi:L-rhamnose-binding lectin CSL3 isoform X2 [Amia ocellicauda]|uniref:L-rhamnose-binding lectin CSL3 isoform X2 n=1 Tax=Amia ocellicauda TaxID=2972642 RepID=UPI003464BCF5
MVCKELLLFILLVPVCCSGCKADIETSITCESTSSQLSCGTDVIEIYSANYGRTDSSICSQGKPTSQLVNVKCFLPQAIDSVSQRCSGKTNCEVTANNAVFTDPCVGTYKYLEITYACIPTEMSITCESFPSQISCEMGSIKIYKANYGRTDSSVCSNNKPSEQLVNVNCYLPKTLDVMSKRCDGKTSCEVMATNDVFSDPCYGTYKYLEVVYACLSVKKSITCEHELAKLQCGSDAIKIYSANYGRTDKSICSVDKPLSQLTNVQCMLPKALNILCSRCDGKKSCEVEASNAVFSDPCVGTFKYLEILYDCLPDC